MTKRRPFQFTVAMLLALTGFVAVVTWALVSKPTEMTGAIVVVLLPVFPAISITGCVNTKGYGRAFWIGAACVSSVIGFTFCTALAGFVAEAPFISYAAWAGTGIQESRQLFDEANGFRPTLFFWWGIMILTGVICVVFRWLLLRGSETDAPL